MRGCAVRKCEKEVETWRDRWSAGSVAFDLERMNELEVFFTDDEADVQGFRTVNVQSPVTPTREPGGRPGTYSATNTPSSTP